MKIKDMLQKALQRGGEAHYFSSGYVSADTKNPENTRKQARESSRRNSDTDKRTAA